MKADLSGKIALIGGSTKGIGKAIAVKLAENGADIVINGRNPELGLKVVTEIEEMGRRAIFQRADLTNYEEVKGMVDTTLERWETLDIVVANGASDYPSPKFFYETEPDLYPEFIKTRMFTRLYMIRAVLDHMRQKQEGKIIMVSTDAGRIPTPGESLLGAAAAGIVHLTKVLAREFSRWKIHINTICTTVTIDTPGYERALKM